MPDFADQLIAELDSAPCWPLPREKRIRDLVRKRRAWRTGDTPHLKPDDWDLDRRYIHDSLARRIAFGFADFLFAQDPVFVAAQDSDQAGLDELVEENRLPARLHRAERVVISEGEAWWKIHTNVAVAPCALLTWCSRVHVVPLFYGDRVLAAAFITERRTLEQHGEDGETLEVVWRHAEVHCDERIAHVLYRGTDTELGARVGLDARTETAAYPETVAHGLPMLAGRIVNDLDDDDTLGVSDFDQVLDELQALDEAVTIATENTRLTAVDRMAVAGRFTEYDGSFDASMQIFQVEGDASELGESSGKPPIVQLEKRYDADPLWLHIGKLVHTILSRVGLVAEFIGSHDEGQGRAESGTAIRLRFMPTTNAADGKMREWRHDLPDILHLMQQAGTMIDGGPRPSTDPPAVEFPDALPIDESQRTVDITTAVAGEIMSRRTAIGQLHPEWDDAQIDEELTAIKDDLGQGQPAGSGVIPPGAPPPAPGPLPHSGVPAV